MVFNGVVRSVQQLRTVLQSVLFVPFAYAVFFNMIPTFLVAWDNATRLQERFTDNFRGRANTYDFIVVGGGTAGSVVANRLSELYSVLLIEEGGPANPLSLIPALTLSMMNRPQTDWRYKTVPQSRACLNSVNQECLISGGRALGGSSTLGHLAYLRGHPVDFDTWARTTGDRSWSYDQVLPYFRRSEEFIGTSTDANARGRDGELRIREPDFLGLGVEWVRAGVEMGFPNVDLNGQHGQGFSILQYPIRRGMRQSADSAFILPIRLSPRLRVLSHTFATRILFRDMTNMAYGVEYERFGRTELAIARREVIISAGALGSPKLLMLSGVGPRAHLEQMGIPIRSELSGVGRNLRDHLSVPLGPFFFTPTSASSFLQDRDFTPTNIISWIVQGRGPLSTSGLQGAAAISSMPARARGESNWPDILLLLHGQGLHSSFPSTFAQAHSLQEDEISRFYDPSSLGRDSFHIQVVGARPTSTGSLLLASTSPRDLPIINPRYLEDSGSADIRILTEGIMAALNLVENSTTFRQMGANLGSNRIPGCDTHTPRSMGYWDCYIRRFSMSSHNPVGTTAMGVVVDSDLKVRGTRGLRVIDASIMPTIVSTGTLATTLMIGEKGADFILREHASNSSTSLPEALTSVVFGRNGLLTRNPIQRFLAREFDRMNPLPSLFRMPINRTDFNPFSRFLGIFGNHQQGASVTGGGGILNSIFSTFNRQTSALLGTLFGTALNITPPPTPTRTIRPRPSFNILQQLGNTVRPPSTRSNTTTPTTNNLFDIIFPVSNNTITLPFQDIYRNQQLNNNNNNNNNFNIFEQLFQPRPQSVTPTTTPRPNNLLNPFAFLLNVGQKFQQNPALVQGILRTGGGGAPTAPPSRIVTSFSTPLTSSSSPIPLAATFPSSFEFPPTNIPSPLPPRFWISLGTTSTPAPTTTLPAISPPTLPSPNPEPEQNELPLSLQTGNDSVSFTLPILEEETTTTTNSASTTTTTPTFSSNDMTTSPMIENDVEEEVPTTTPTPISEENEINSTLSPSSSFVPSPEDIIPSAVVPSAEEDNLRAIRLISKEAEKFRLVQNDLHPSNLNSQNIHYNDNDFAPALPAKFQVDHQQVPFYDYDEVAKFANNLANTDTHTNTNGNDYHNVDFDFDSFNQY